MTDSKKDLATVLAESKKIMEGKSEWLTERDREIQLMKAGIKEFPLYIDFLKLQVEIYENRKHQFEQEKQLVKVMEEVIKRDL